MAYHPLLVVIVVVINQQDTPPYLLSAIHQKSSYLQRRRVCPKVPGRVSHRRTAELTVSALQKALMQPDVRPGMLFHSDRGSEYGAHLFQDELKRADIWPSMNRPGHMTDNAHVESFFKTLKTESFNGLSFESITELRMTLSWYIDDYYNTKRLEVFVK